MPTFGPHHTADRLHLSGVGALYLLASDHSRVLKILQPTDGVWSETYLRHEIDAFLLRHKIQRLLAKSSRHWAPVHNLSAIKGEVPADIPYPRAYRASGAYAVTDKHERSLQSLLDSHIHISNNDLRNLFTQIITGLLDAKKSLNRPHGNLKPANVLLSNSANLAAATVHLSDPAADGALPAKLPFEKDLHDLGRLIYALVMRRPFDGGTIGPSREWKALGPNGEDWRKLAANLLDVGEATTPDERDLEKILPRIATWTAQPKKAPVVPIAIAAAVLIAAGGIGLYFLLRAPTANFDQPIWARLCLDYDSWFGQFLDDATAEKNRQLFTSNPKYPAQVIAILDAAAKKHDLSSYKPQSLAKSAHTLEDLAVHPTPDAKSGVNAYRTRESLQMVDAVAAALSPGQWPLLTSLDKTEKSYRDRGWLKPANAIAALIAAARPPEFSKLPTENADPPQVEPVNEFARVNATIAAANAVSDIEARWTHIQDGLAKLPKTDVPLLLKLPDFAISVARSPDEPGTLQDVTALAAAFAKVQSVVDQLDTELNRKDQTILFDQLAKDPAAQVPADGPTFDSYAALPALAKGYVKLPTDPRDSVAWQKSLDEIQHDMIAVINEQNPQDPNLPTLQKDHQALITFVNNWRDIPPIEKNHDRLATLVSQAKTNLDKLREEGGAWVAPYIIDPPVYIAQQTERITKSPLAKATPVVYNEWKTHQAALVAKAQALGPDLKKYQTFKAIDKKFNDLEQAYITLDTRTLPAAVPGLSDLAAGAANGAGWQKVIAAHVATVYRDRALTDLMTNPALKWVDDLPQFSDASYQSYQRQRLQQFDDLRKSTLDLIADYTTIQTRLDHLDLLPNEPTPGAQTWRDLFKKWAGGGDAHSPLLSDETILTALKPITDRVQALLALDTQNDYAPVVADAESPAPELALSAWRKLATIPITEKNPALEDELKIQSHLKDLFSTLTQDKRLTDAHADALRQSLAQALPTRWKSWTDTLSTPETIQWALDHVKDFNVALSAQSNPRMMYNQLLYDLRKANEQNLKEDQLKPIATTFVTQASALPAAGNPLIKGMLANLDKTIHQNAAAEASAAGAGPKLAGWEQDKVKDGVNVFYYPSKATHTLALEFDRVTVGDKQIFLSSTEIPVGVFIDVMNRSGKVAALNDANFPKEKQHWVKFPPAGGDQWVDVGPRSWKIVGANFSINDLWTYTTFPEMQIGNTDAYEPPYPAGTHVPNPSANAPVQAISPYTAMYFARLLGCRLPTSDEWHTAFLQFESTATSRDAWNLRGTSSSGLSWVAQQKYANQIHDEHHLPFPDQGVFAGSLSFDNSTTGKNATPWSSDALAKLFPSRVSSASGTYNGSTLWFRDVGHEPGFPTSLGAGYIHDLVGNVAEYVFDAPSAEAPIKDTNVSTDAIDAALGAASMQLFVIGGSSLSPPQLPLDKPENVDLTMADDGFCDVGIRLAYTAPIATLKEVLDGIFQKPPYLPGPNAKPTP
ncbi:MAG TPA: SUMF1/EgtB/PvdO family nonheme iron enzyme [Phycisphaerae bacterium]|nr:SUMF1/EgtB/PvdO family nonheme iron enzyme [Phycisphaerae bacterium]